jgi:DNA-binding transcriptional regulator PaaX
MTSKSPAARMTTELLTIIAGNENPYEKGGYSRMRTTRKLRDMYRDGYLHKAKHIYRLAPRGIQVLREEKMWELKIPTPNKWDGKWHMVLFDIPVTRGKQRNAFRARLKDLGLVLYQQSVWVYPYPLEKIVRQISDFYKLSNHVLFVVAEELNAENKLKNKFGLN